VPGFCTGDAVTLRDGGAKAGPAPNLGALFCPLLPSSAFRFGGADVLAV